MKAKINEIETKKIKSRFSEKINKIKKPLANLTKMGRKRPK
jgi:hypothetical protein